MGYKAELDEQGLVMVEEDRPVCILRSRLAEQDFYDLIGENPVVVADDTHHPFTHCINGRIWVRLVETEEVKAEPVEEVKPKRKPRKKKVEA